MFNAFYQTLEHQPAGSRHAFNEALEHLHFNHSGLIPVITQDQHSRQVLMMAWMNREAILATLDSGEMVYWSRSRKNLWRKGETSGHRQHCFYLTVNKEQNNVVVD